MLQKNFKQFYLDNILDFLWKQWSALGIAGSAQSEDQWVIDLEALLIFSLKMTRYEPRLFDEIIDWLVINGKWIDVQRLKSILNNKDDEIKRLISAVAFFISSSSNTYQRKWKSLIVFKKDILNNQYESLFKTKDDKPYPESNIKSKPFYKYGFLRNDFNVTKKSKPVAINVKTNILFLLRSFFGPGTRSECILFLLTHEAGHPSEIADEIGYSTKGTQDALIELAESGLVLTRIKGKRRKEYWLSQKRWWEFFTGMNYEEIKTSTWLNWIALFNALKNVWNILNEIEKTKSVYMRSSKLRHAMETISQEFQKSKIILPNIPAENTKPEIYEKEFQNFIIRVLGAEDGSNR